jgi:hypothetical protein
MPWPDRASGKLMRTIMAGLAEFERDLIRDRVKFGLAAASARGVWLGRQIGQRPSDKKAKRAVLSAHCPQRRLEQEHGDGDRQAWADLCCAVAVLQDTNCSSIHARVQR